jgi:hypothetical protein
MVDHFATIVMEIGVGISGKQVASIVLLIPRLWHER